MGCIKKKSYFCNPKFIGLNNNNKTTEKVR
jgi:hypothetical protein